MNENQRVMAEAMSEADLQQAVIEQATTLGFKVYHTYDSRKSHKGFPDLVLVEYNRIIFAELKRQDEKKGKVRPEQQEWINAIQEIHDRMVDSEIYHNWIRVYLWRPEHWVTGEIEQILLGNQ